MGASGCLTKLAEKISQKFLRNYFLVLAKAFLKITNLQVICSFSLSLNTSEVYLEPSETSRWSLFYYKNS